MMRIIYFPKILHPIQTCLLYTSSIPPDARKLISLKQSSYRIRAGDYRILYRIEKDSIVVFSINKRSVVYKR